MSGWCFTFQYFRKCIHRQLFFKIGWVYLIWGSRADSTAAARAGAGSGSGVASRAPCGMGDWMGGSAAWSSINLKPGGPLRSLGYKVDI
jgi:hypothetical protein